jgi:hypothetical protein
VTLTREEAAMSWDLDTPTTDTTTTTPGPVIEETSRTGRTLTIIGFVCAVLALMLLPVLFGIAAVVCGAVGRWSGDRLGTWAIVAGVLCMLGGLAIANAAVNNGRVG